MGPGSLGNIQGLGLWAKGCCRRGHFLACRDYGFRVLGFRVSAFLGSGI